MTTEESSEPRTPDGQTPPERTAAEFGSLVADEVRAAIDSAEGAAEKLRRRAREDAAADRAHIHRAAAVARERIDAVEAQIGQLLAGLREEVTRIVEQAEREVEQAERELELEQRPAVAEPPARNADTRVDGAKPGRRRRGLFGRRRRALPQCAVCGRTAEDGDEDVDRWRRVGRVGLCPTCQADGWQVPEGASVPYRSPRGRGS